MKTLITLIILSLSSIVMAQNGQVKGRVIDQESKEVMPFVKVSLEKNGMVMYRALSDFDGKFLFENVQPGEYKLLIHFVGYDPVEESITVKSSDTSEIIHSLRNTDIPVCVCNIYYPEIDLNSRNREVGAPPTE